MNEYIGALVDELGQLGVRHAVLSAGSRSTPLSLWFVEEPSIATYMQVDERSAAFFALGLAKRLDEPVVLVCTSGSAAAHYWPALTEAWHSRIPLIVLTADRPPEAQFVGAPQTIDQTKLYGDLVKHFETLVIPSEEQAHTYPRMVARKAYMYANAVPKGPVHVNVPIREPLMPQLSAEGLAAGRSEHPFHFESGLSMAPFDPSFLIGKRGVIVAGPDSSQSHDGKMSRQESFLALAKALHIPILGDPLSNMRLLRDPQLIDAYDAFLSDFSVKEVLKPEYILLLGQAPVSKRLQQLIGQNKKIPCIQVDGGTEFRNPGLTTNTYIQADPESFAQSLCHHPLVKAQSKEPTGEQKAYVGTWRAVQEACRHRLDGEAARLAMAGTAFEGTYIHALSELMDGGQLFIANSMSIRDMDYFWKQGQPLPVYGNRGTNGIDGTISSALGLAAAVPNCGPTVLITGDLSFMHDMNGLLIGKHHQIPLIIILFNNDGGGIFHHLPQRDSAPNFDYVFSTPQGLNYEAVGPLFGMSYECPSDYEVFAQAFRAARHRAEAERTMTVIELRTDKEGSVALHRQIITAAVSAAQEACGASKEK